MRDCGCDGDDRCKRDGSTYRDRSGVEGTGCLGGQAAAGKGDGSLVAVLTGEGEIVGGRGTGWDGRGGGHGSDREGGQGSRSAVIKQDGGSKEVIARGDDVGSAVAVDVSQG